MAPDDAFLALGENDLHLPALLELVGSGQGVVPWVGAGLGVPFGLPSWSGLLRVLGARCGVAPEVETHLAAGEYEEAAECVERSAGASSFHKRLEKVYGPNALQDRPLDGAVKHLPALARGPVVTTNFDRLLEGVFESAGRRFETVVPGRSAWPFRAALDGGRRALLKLHGDIEDRANRVLTLSEYDACYGSQVADQVDLDKPLPQVLRRLFSARPILFVGCSLGVDRTLLLLSRVAADLGDAGCFHYALLEYPGDAAWLERSRALQTYRIFPVWYAQGRHEQLEPLLAHLAAVPPTGSPRGLAPPPSPPPVAQGPRAPRTSADAGLSSPPTPPPTLRPAPVPWDLDPQVAARLLDPEQPLLVLSPRRFGKTSWAQRLLEVAGDRAGRRLTLEPGALACDTLEGFAHSLVNELARGLGRDGRSAHEAWSLLDVDAPMQRLMVAFEALIDATPEPWITLVVENPGDLPTSDAALDLELFGLLRRAAHWAREGRATWRRLQVIVTTSATPTAWVTRLNRPGTRTESSFFDLAQRHFLADLSPSELTAVLRRWAPAVTAVDACARIRAVVGGGPHLVSALLSGGPDDAELDARLSAPLERAQTLRSLLDLQFTRLVTRSDVAPALPGLPQLEPKLRPRAVQEAIFAEGLCAQDGAGSPLPLCPVWSTYLKRSAGGSA